MSHFRTPKTPRFCGICGGPPDEHYPDCPILTGEAQPGNPETALQQLYGPQLLHSEQNMLGSVPNFSYEVQFVGGPLDGPNRVDPAQNYRLQIPGDTSGYYELLSDLRYHWIPEQK